METIDRFTRQRRLREVGDAGQARISEAYFEISGGDSPEVERSYLERAGALRVEVNEQRPSERFAHAVIFRHGAARSVALGAWGALEKLRHILELEDR